jgi:hypothetical protein
MPWVLALICGACCALQQKTWKDEDIKEDVDYIVDKMMQYVSELRCVAKTAYTTVT